MRMEGVVRDDNSGLTIDNSSGFVDQEETSSIDNHDVEWTNEKHSLYLKSMEASFVAQLYNMKGLFSWSHSSQQRADVNTCRQGSPSGSEQFEARVNCHRTKKNRRMAPTPDGESPGVAPDHDANELGNSSRILNEECSDQNFMNADAENGAARGQRAKRLRLQNASAAINNDQVVPSGMLCLPIQDRMKTARVCRTER